MTSAELMARARQIELLAEEVDGCVDPSWSIARSPDWRCAHADQVRGDLDRWRAAARSSARGLREEASLLRAQARRAAEREQAGVPQAW